MNVGRLILGVALCFISIGAFANGDTLIAFIVLLVGVVLIVAKSGKKGESSELKISVNTSESLKLIKPMQEKVSSEEGLTFAHEYFGLEWEDFLLVKGLTSKPDRTFYNEIGLAYDLLNSDNKKRLLLSFIKIETNSQAGQEGLSISIGLENDFESMYNDIYELLINNQFSHNQFCLAFLKLIEDMKKQSKMDTLETDKSIIDITGKEQKLIYNNDQKIVKQEEERNYVESLPYLYDDIRLGTKYKSQLGLSNQDVSWLNKFWRPSNVFISIEGCSVATINLYLKVLKALQSKFKKEGTTLNNQSSALGFWVMEYYKANNIYYYGADFNSNSQLLERVDSEVFQTLFQLCENFMREIYDHKRKLSAIFLSSGTEINAEFNKRFGKDTIEILESLKSSTLAPDTETEIELNQQNTGRWKSKFDELVSSFSPTHLGLFVNNIYQLGELNKKNPSLENIYFEASKFLAKFDRLESIKLYLHYLYADLKSTKIDSKQLAKTIQKSLFRNKEEVHEFEKVVSALSKDRDIIKAIEAAPSIFAKRRKKIQLDDTLIKEVKAQHSETVEILNGVLDDEYEDNDTKIKIVESGAEEMQIDISVKTLQEVPKSEFLAEANLNKNQELLLKLFEENNFVLTTETIDSFTRDKGLFKNQLIDSVNEKCFESVDDVLIEEGEYGYEINKEYFNKIKNHD